MDTDADVPVVEVSGAFPACPGWEDGWLGALQGSGLGRPNSPLGKWEAGQRREELYKSQRHTSSSLK